MSKGIQRAYIVVGLALTAFLLYYCMRYRDNVSSTLTQTGFEVLHVMGIDEDQGSVICNDGWTGKFSVDGITGKFCHLMFYSKHVNVEIYHGAELIYSMKPSAQNAFAKTPGCVWNDLLLTEDLNGETLRVTLTPIYKRLSFGIPDFYLGEKGSIVRLYLGKELGIVIVSLLLVLTGLAVVAYVFYNLKNSEVDKNLASLGWLASLVGWFRVSDTSIFKLLFSGFPIFSFLPYMFMMLSVIPFVLFMRNLYATREFRIWYVPCWISLGVMCTGLFLQLFNLMDLRQILILIQSSLLIAVGVVLYMTVLELKRSGWSRKLRGNLIGMLLVTMGIVMDMATYYVSNGRRATPYLIIGFLMYSIAQCVFIFRESNKLIDEGRVAYSMENLAYHDKLTGLYNRAAFIVDTDPYAVRPAKYSVVVLDLNDLKYCNDHLGHEMGDKYIKESAEIIKSTFGTIGNCYRMGGDEFYCLVPSGGREACVAQQKAMDSMVEYFNSTSTDIQISIACGFAQYDGRIDYDLNATSKRADQMMYQNKEKMKKNRA